MASGPSNREHARIQYCETRFDERRRDLRNADSLFSAFSVVPRSIALIHVEHPAYLSVLLLADSMTILLVHKCMGRRDSSDLFAGFGVVACAVALVVIKSFH
jgi:hypothetical protein